MITSFLNYLTLERNYSARTVKLYGFALRDFERFFKEKDENLTWEDVDADLIRAWVMAMMAEGRIAATVNGYLSGIRSFYRYLLRTGRVTRDPSHLLKGPKKAKVLPSFVKEREMEELLVPGRFGDDYRGVLAYTVLNVFYQTGLRVSELVGLDAGRVDLSGCQLKVLGKRNKERIIPFADDLRECLYIYNKVKAETFPESWDVQDEWGRPYFLNEKGRRVSTAYIERMVKECLSGVTSLRKRTPHVLRHTFATTMMNHHADLVAVKELLGHASLTTTEVYTHTSLEELKEVYKQALHRA